MRRTVSQFWSTYKQKFWLFLTSSVFLYLPSEYWIGVAFAVVFVCKIDHFHLLSSGFWKNAIIELFFLTRNWKQVNTNNQTDLCACNLDEAVFFRIFEQSPHMAAYLLLTLVNWKPSNWKEAFWWRGISVNFDVSLWVVDLLWSLSTLTVDYIFVVHVQHYCHHNTQNQNVYNT